MNQKDPLINYKIKCCVNVNRDTEKICYDFASGLWINESGEPVVRKYVENSQIDANGETLLTKTREGIDRSEGSNSFTDYEYNSKNKFSKSFGKTSISETRESIDRSENSFEFVEQSSNNLDTLNLTGETLLTRTREGIDRSESSSYDSSALETTITFTRESVDRSEKV